ncbi:MAG: hypothetical protein J3K34DRAFT_442202 [Monoraphidium minutum]|nr:MAG: hypothetical protein J3K34DRAFT_442202 [Monoraphidium minutum]
MQAGKAQGRGWPAPRISKALRASRIPGACASRTTPATRRVCFAALAAAAASEAPPARSLDECRAHDLVQCRTSGGAAEFLEVLRGWDGASADVMWKGQLLKAERADGAPDGSWRLSPFGVYPAADSAVVAAFPLLAQVLPAMQAQAGPPPAAVEGGRVVASLDWLLTEVERDPSFWCDGLAPGAPPQSALQQALFTAGELAAFSAGRRGLALVQLFNGWDRSRGQPVYTPFALELLARALPARGVGAAPSVAPGGAGLTAVLFADRAPFAARAAHLCSFGCQANMVAGSSYYKLLIGLLLGYRRDRVEAYVASSGEPVGGDLRKQVDDDIRQLSAVEPRLPWSTADALPAPEDAAPAPAAAPADAAAARPARKGKKAAAAGGGFGGKAGGRR